MQVNCKKQTTLVCSTGKRQGPFVDAQFIETENEKNQTLSKFIIRLSLASRLEDKLISPSTYF